MHGHATARARLNAGSIATEMTACVPPTGLHTTGCNMPGRRLAQPVQFSQLHALFSSKMPRLDGQMLRVSGPAHVRCPLPAL